jgi:malyl-CoA/(S)-citramalyl-CoA lyase
MTLCRSVLTVPASSERFIERAAGCPADAIVLDLEDSVPPDLKVAARRRVVRALQEIEWGRRKVLVRVNPIDSAWGARDLLEIGESGARFEGFVLPKCDTPSHVIAVALLLRGIREGAADSRELAVHALLESAAAINAAEQIAHASTELTALVFGPGDYQRDMRMPPGVVGGPLPEYAVLADASAGLPRASHWNDPWHYALARVANAGRAAGLAILDGPFVDIGDSEGLRSASLRARALGFDGKWAIHPSQIECLNEVFSPSAVEVAWAHECMALVGDAAAAGRGAIRGGDGRMIDLAQLRTAEAILQRHDSIASLAGARR